MQSIRFKNDTAIRKRFFDDSAMSHPAKLHCGLLLEILARYCPEPATILDPMAGIGTLMLAAQYGHRVILNEMEPHFLETIPKSWAKIQRNGPALGHTLGEVLILRGDARALPIASADHIVTSPPYEGIAITAGDQARSPSILFPEGERTDRGKIKHDGLFEKGYTRPVDAVVSSPPYEGSISQGRDGIDWSVAHREDGSIRDMTKEPHTSKTSAYRGYTNYEKARAKVEAGIYQGLRPDVWTSPTNMAAHGYLDGYSGQAENIGNLHGQAYWDSMRLCYAEMHRVLKPNGILCLVLKGFTRDGKYVDLPAMTTEVVLNAHRMLYCQCESQIRYKVQSQQAVSSVRNPDRESRQDVSETSASSAYSAPQHKDQGHSPRETPATDLLARTRDQETSQPQNSNGEAAQASSPLPALREGIEQQESAATTLPSVLSQDQGIPPQGELGTQGNPEFTKGNRKGTAKIYRGGKPELEGGHYTTQPRETPAVRL